MSKIAYKHPSVSLFLTVFILVLTAMALMTLAALASRMRLTGDDYCYNAILAREGFWGMQSYSYLSTGLYNGNRFSLTFFSGLAGLFPRFGSGFLSIFALLMWLLGLTLLVDWGNKKIQLKLSLLEEIVIAGIFATLVLWSTPNLEQSFYWRSGMLPYFMPLVGGTWLLLLVIWVSESRKNQWFILILLFLAAIIVGGFSETGLALQGGFWGLYFLIALLLSRFSKDKSLAYVLPALSVLLGTIFALALLFFSPSTAIRRMDLNPSPDLITLISLLGLNIKVYLWIALFRRTLTILLPFILGTSLSFLILTCRRKNFSFQKDILSWQKGLLILILFATFSLILIAFVMLPATYIWGDYPPERALILSQVVLTFSCIFIGGLLVVILNSLFSSIFQRNVNLRNGLCYVSLFIFLSFLIAPIMLINSELSQWRIFNKWSRMWDDRHERLIQSGLVGDDEIHVVQLDHVIRDVGELGSDEGYWYNNCAEMYYGIDKIYADQPGW